MRAVTTLLALCVGVLLSLGMVMLFSSTLTLADAGRPLRAGWEAWRRDPALWQLAWAVMGLVLAVGVACIDYRHLRRFWWVIYAGALLLLVVVLVKGLASHGATRWLRVGPISFQPSEFAKLALVIALAWYGERYQQQMGEFVRGLVIPGVMVVAVLGLVFLEPDWGTTLLLGAVAGVMLLAAGVRWTHLFPLVATGVVGVGAFLMQNPVRLGRVLSWLDPEATKEGVGYQVYQAKLALGSGGLTGVGLGNGQQYSFVPESQTDFIFALLGEELGFVCTAGVVVIFVMFLVCGIHVASRARDTFGALLAAGVTFLVSLQGFINLGVVTGLLPNKGLPLPLVSRGGSNLLMLLLGIGLLFSVARCSARARGAVSSTAEGEEVPSPQVC